MGADNTTNNFSAHAPCSDTTYYLCSLGIVAPSGALVCYSFCHPYDTNYSQQSVHFKI